MFFDGNGRWPIPIARTGIALGGGEAAVATKSSAWR